MSRGYPRIRAQVQDVYLSAHLMRYRTQVYIVCALWFFCFIIYINVLLIPFNKAEPLFSTNGTNWIRIISTLLKGPNSYVQIVDQYHQLPAHPQRA